MTAANDPAPLSLHDALAISLVIIPPRPLNERLWKLHQLSATGKATAAEERELDAICAEMDHREAGVANNAPASTR